MSQSDVNAPPFNPVPMHVWLLVILILGPELIFQGGALGFIGGAEAVGWRSEAVNQFATRDIYLDRALAGRWTTETLYPYLTFSFVSNSTVNAVFGAVMVLAIGNVVGRVLNPIGFVLMFLLSAAAGAVFYHFIDTETYPLFGPFTGVFGLLGAYAWLNFLALGNLGAEQTRAFNLVGLLLLIGLGFTIAFGGPNTWIAELGAAVAGFLLSFVMMPGALRRLRRK